MALIFERKFAPFFWTQFLGAFTDNAFKQALVLMIAFRATMLEAETGMLIALASGLFILPYFLFSPLAGQVADKYDKATIMRRVKVLEIVIMLLAAGGFVLADAGFEWADACLIGILFLMGTQSTFFGPVKYSIIPQHVREEELMEGTALVESGTFVAILTGTIVGGILILQSAYLVGTSLVALSVAGWLSSRKIPFAAPSNPDTHIRWNWIGEYRQLYRVSKQKNSVFLSIIGISWFWFLGAMVMAMLPNFVKLFVHGDESVYILFLSLFTLSIAAGSVLTHVLSDTSIELGMVPFGLFGLSLFPLDIGLLDYGSLDPQTLNITAILAGDASATVYRVIVDVCGMGVAGSFFIVPLYALLQHRTAPETRSQVIAANNVAGAFFMVGSAVAVSVLYGTGFSTSQLFLILAALNLVTSMLLLVSHPEFLLRFWIWVFGLTRYRVRYVGRSNIPSSGACLLYANPVGWLNWSIVTAACDRPVRFVYPTGRPKSKGSRLLRKWFGAIPVDNAREPEPLEDAVGEIREALGRGEVVCLFNTVDAGRGAATELLTPRLETALEVMSVHGIPIAVRGLTGSTETPVESQAEGTRLRTLVEVHVGEAQLEVITSADLSTAAHRLLAST